MIASGRSSVVMGGAVTRPVTILRRLSTRRAGGRRFNWAMAVAIVTVNGCSNRFSGGIGAAAVTPAPPGFRRLTGATTWGRSMISGTTGRPSGGRFMANKVAPRKPPRPTDGPKAAPGSFSRGPTTAMLPSSRVAGRVVSRRVAAAEGRLTTTPGSFRCGAAIVMTSVRRVCGGAIVSIVARLVFALTASGSAAVAIPARIAARGPISTARPGKTDGARLVLTASSRSPASASPGRRFSFALHAPASVMSRVNAVPDAPSSFIRLVNVDRARRGVTPRTLPICASVKNAIPLAERPVMPSGFR